MKNISIRGSIHFIFCMSFILIWSGFFFYIEYDKHKFKANQNIRYKLIANAFLGSFSFSPNDKQLEKLYEKFQVRNIDSPQKKLEILNNAQTVFLQENLGSRVRGFVYKKRYYLYVQEHGFNIMLKDLQTKSYSMLMPVVLFCLVSILFLLSYFAILKKLQPLSKLNQQILDFAQGNLQIDFETEGKDEIATIGKNFQKASQNIKSLIESKNLFMRNMMHELKTPIAKGMFALEMIPHTQDTQVLHKAFERMNELISNLAQIEKVSSKNLKLTKEKVSCLDMIHTSCGLLMCQEEALDIDCSKSDTVYVDKNLFTIAIKNLLDNALKFCTHGSVCISCNSHFISFSNYASALKKPLEYYSEAFSQEQKREEGLGLGLYITKTIVELHGFELQYHHKDNKNIFTIIL